MSPPNNEKHCQKAFATIPIKMSPYFIITDASSCALLFLSNDKGDNISRNTFTSISQNDGVNGDDAG